MDTVIRPLRAEEYPLLSGFLYHAIFLPAGTEPPPHSIIQAPELQIYYQDFGTKPDDFALCAERYGQIIGAVWVRIMPDYGHIDDNTPSFAVSLLPEFRGNGVGTALMKAMLHHLRQCGYQAASLAVQKENYAERMYRALGFEKVGENAEEYIMIYRLSL